MRIAYVIKPLDFVQQDTVADEYDWWVAKSPIGDFEIDQTVRNGKTVYELIKWDGDSSNASVGYDHIGYFTNPELAMKRASGFLEMILEPYLEDVSDLIEWI